jgi:uncharacterized repeat protein (TIGR03917 family)
MTVSPPELVPYDEVGFPNPVTLIRVDRGQLVEHELNIAPGASAVEVATELAAVPAGALFMDHYGDVDRTLVFRQIVPPE